MTLKVGVAGLGSIGSVVANALDAGIEGLQLEAVSTGGPHSFSRPIDNVSFKELAERCDLIVEALPAEIVPALARPVFEKQKDLILISSCALLLSPKILDIHKDSHSRIYVPAGALRGIKDLKHWASEGITQAKIKSTKHPSGFEGAPYVEKMGTEMAQISVLTKIYDGTAAEAAKGFPANVNVAATLSFAGIGPDKTLVELWADPNAEGNTHEVQVIAGGKPKIGIAASKTSTENRKSSTSTADSIIDVLKDRENAVILLPGKDQNENLKLKHAAP